MQKPCIIVGSKLDVPEAAENLDALKEEWGRRFPVLAISAEQRMRMEEFGRGLFRHLNIIRVYTKSPGKKPDMDEPFILRQGSTVEDLAKAIHKELTNQFKYARIWGTGVFEGQTVQREHGLVDKDVVEIHA